MILCYFVKMKKNILFINHSVRDGGPGRSLFYLLKHFDYNKYNVHVLIPSKNTFSENIKNENLNINEIISKNFPENLKKQNFNILGKSISIFPLDILINFIRLIILSITLKNLINKNKIELIYCNGTQAKVFGSIVGFIYNIKTIWHVRNIQTNFFFKWLINTCGKFKNVKKIICVSNATSEQFRLRSKNIVINNGIDTDEFSNNKIIKNLRNEYKIEKNKIILGTAGRIVPRKGFEYFIEVCKEISHVYKKDCVFAIVGDTPFYFKQNLMKKLKDKVDEYNLTNKFIFTGYKKDVESYIADFDIFFIPSRYPDPFPRVVIESMALSKPIIGFKIGGIGEAIDNGINGYSHKINENPTKNIVSLIENENLRLNMGFNSRKKSVNQYDSRIIANKILLVLESLFSSGSKA